MSAKGEQLLRYTAVFEPAEEGGYTVTVPILPGCISEGDTFEEAKNNIEEAILSYLGSLQKDKLPIPKEETQPFVGQVSVSA